jgi:hypothetical protein
MARKEIDATGNIEGGPFDDGASEFRFTMRVRQADEGGIDVGTPPRRTRAMQPGVPRRGCSPVCSVTPRKVRVCSTPVSVRGPVRVALNGPVSTACPASILRTRSNVTLHLDRRSAADVAA